MESIFVGCFSFCCFSFKDHRAKRRFLFYILVSYKGYIYSFLVSLQEDTILIKLQWASLINKCQSDPHKGTRYPCSTPSASFMITRKSLTPRPPGQPWRPWVDLMSVCCWRKTWPLVGPWARSGPPEEETPGGSSGPRVGAFRNFLLSHYYELKDLSSYFLFSSPRR